MRRRAYPERTCIMSKKHFIPTPPAKEYYKEQGCNHNTDFCVNVKTILRNDSIAVTGKHYNGELTRDSEEHYTFIETLPPKVYKRNPRVFDGKYITVTRWKDGSLQPNFKPIKEGRGFRAFVYARGVANELLWAFESLLEKEAAK